uniref:EF-hand domain-containing protein n=1 Tax=Haptolina brevifila TaxID=156173 RepID=A0A6U7CIF5_9EUKA
MSAMDVDGSGFVKKSEFVRALKPLAKEESVDDTQLSALFDKLDRNQSGALSVNDLMAFQRDRGPNEVATRGGGTRKSSGFKGALPMSKLDEHDQERSITQQLRDDLRANKGRVIDLFRAWDEDDGGTVSREEFQKAMMLMGIKAHTAVVDDLFDAFDLDKSGFIEISELEKILRDKSKDIWADHTLTPSKQTKLVSAPATEKRQSRILELCDKLGYPEQMSIDEYLQTQSKLDYMTLQDARVEIVLHQMRVQGTQASAHFPILRHCALLHPFDRHVPTPQVAHCFHPKASTSQDLGLADAAAATPSPAQDATTGATI